MAGGILVHWRGLTITWERAAQVGGLLLLPIPLFIGLHLLRANRVVVSAGPAWVPAVLAGLLILS